MLNIRRGRLTTEKWFSPTLQRRDAFGFVLYKQVPQASGTLGFVKSSFQTIVIDLTQTQEEIFAHFSEATRRQIRKAEKLGIVCQPATADEFTVFYNTFAAQRGILPLRQRDLHQYSPHLLIMKAVHGNDTLAMRACLIDEGLSRARELKSGSTRLASQQASQQKHAGYANRVLHWTLIQRLKELGYELYDFGGCEVNSNDPEVANITRFKLGFSKQVVDEHEFCSWPLFLKDQLLRRLYRLAHRGGVGK